MMGKIQLHIRNQEKKSITNNKKYVNKKFLKICYPVLQKHESRSKTTTAINPTRMFQHEQHSKSCIVRFFMKICVHGSVEF